MNTPYFAYSFTCRWTLEFLPLTFIVNNAAVSRSMQKSLPDLAFNMRGYIHNSGIAGSCANSTFNFLRKCCLAFHSGYTVLYSHKGSDFSHLCQHWLFSLYLSVCLFYNSHPDGHEVFASRNLGCLLRKYVVFGAAGNMSFPSIHNFLM